MIGRLRGRVLSDEATGAVVIDVHGVGYDVLTPVGTLGRARVDANAEVELWVHTHVREDALDLFGFASETDRRVFRLLLSVQSRELSIWILTGTGNSARGMIQQYLERMSGSARRRQ